MFVNFLALFVRYFALLKKNLNVQKSLYYPIGLGWFCRIVRAQNIIYHGKQHIKSVIAHICKPSVIKLGLVYS